ncbi:LtfC-like domain-containing protein [Mycobacteroides chelonae]|jgi:hypothetical protein|uniref:LtfC-like domain-containing protein n=1 Tax=Mycobacteroides chelonae TaxID=1774 RepID=UPI0008A92797|nr:hypothetical protein [Mycobacteroides chelonae]MBF9325998.1 hypothetical protein [Mycobacteroides chelonae]MBF9420174.1 hypothetical protein [Mycobacteroides chelonae]MBF9438642.1 hypothetical protein [Mycobacteroides chelonae]MBV6359951.1 hypothetical protein [Mycobacteroides chelonae]MEC4834446.1 hypothetical protein [Mycobacteroides chelonae]
MTTPLIGGYDPDLQITLSIRQDFLLLLSLKADEDGNKPNIRDIFPAGTTIDLRFYADLAAVRSGNEINGTAIQPEITDDGVFIRIESTVADKIPARAEARLTVTYPSTYPNGDNLPWGKCKVSRDD